MDVRYRAAEPSDIADAAGLFLTTVADLAARNGLPRPTMFTREGVESVYTHILETGIFRVAELDGKLVSICNAIVREHQWFLSMFWTLPEYQRRKIGRPLLQQVWEKGRARGATTAFTWSSIDFAAMATYMRLGLLPAGQIFTFYGEVRSVPEPPAAFELAPLDDATASDIDLRVRGVRRAVDHAYLKRSGAKPYAVRAGGGVVGYFYVGGGTIGPAAWADPAHGRAVLALALREAVAETGEGRMMVPACNHTAVVAALDAGLQLVGNGHLLRTEAFGAMDQYLPSGPALF